MSDQDTDTKSNEESPYAGVTDTELEAIETATLSDHRKEAKPLTDEEYERHYEYIRRVRKALPSTHKQFTHTVKGKSVYLDERIAQHDEIVAKLVESTKSAPTDRKAIFVGGISGSGKTTAVSTLPIFKSFDFAAVNPDQIKTLMVELGMTPAVKGLLPLETDELIKYEAQVIFDKVYEALSARGTNLLIDRTITSVRQITKTVDDLRGKGYSDLIGVFIDVDSEEAQARIRARHRAGIDRYLTGGEGYGERSVPGFAISSTKTDDPNYRSKNAKAFVELVEAGAFDGGAYMFDSSNQNQEISLD